MAKTGILLTNLGTPDAPDTKSVRRYLAEFLSDPRVIERSKWLWLPILHGIILRTRPRRSAKAYQKIWTDAGSPLMVETQALREKLQALLGDDYVVAVGMRYGTPSLKTGLLALKSQGVRDLIVLPLYPQFSATTSATTFDRIAELLRNCRGMPHLRFVRDYHDHPAYIDALSASIRSYWDQQGKADCLLMSFHGLPQIYVDRGDPYETQCLKTAELLADKLGLSEDDYRVTFQSRLGPMQWLQPYTDKTLEALPAEGVKSIQVVCPGFPVDCLETLEEIAMMNRDLFLTAGGEAFAYIPALNHSDEHVDFLKNLVL